MNYNLDIIGLGVGIMLLVQEQPYSFILGLTIGFCFICIPYIINKWRSSWKKKKQKKKRK